MGDFTRIAGFLRTSKDVEGTLRSFGFRCVEELSPKVGKSDGDAEYSSEIWVRREGAEYMAVRIDWRGHPEVPAHYAGHPAHIHLESFPVEQFSAYLIGPARDVVKYDVQTGLPSTDFAATHGRVRVVP